MAFDPIGSWKCCDSRRISRAGHCIIDRDNDLTFLGGQVEAPEVMRIDVPVQEGLINGDGSTLDLPCL
jgi:hypothetical protein